MPTRYERELQLAIDAVRSATLLCDRVQADIAGHVLQKADQSPVTLADFASQAIVCRRLAQQWDDPIVAEESAAVLRQPDSAELLEQIVARVRDFLPEATAEEVCDWIDLGGRRQAADRYWTLDPIDGTKGFLRGEHYVVALALIVSGQIEVSVIGCPTMPFDSAAEQSSGTIYYAERGAGAWKVPLEGDEAPARLQVSQQADVLQARFCESVEPGHSWQENTTSVAARLEIDAPPVRIDSMAKYALVAQADVEFYLRVPTDPDRREAIWDHAAGVLLVEEAGGTVTDLSGQPLDFGHCPRLDQNYGLIVSNGPLHPRVLAAVNGE